MPGALGTTALPSWPALLFSYLEPRKPSINTPSFLPP